MNRASPFVIGALALVLFVLARTVAAEEAAPGLADDVIAQDASEQLRLLVAALDEREQAALRGIYVAIEPSRTEVLALPACDDDGDYVVVLSRGLLELVQQVAFADASDGLRGTHLLESYGPLLARAQRRDARPLPPAPSPRQIGPSFDNVGDAARELADAFTQEALAWLVADEVARAVSGEVVCPRPTATRESGDDEWTANEQAEAVARAPSRMGLATARAADAWATRQVLLRARTPAPEVPAIELLDVMASLEDARPFGAAWLYFALHPRSRERADALRVTAWVWREDRAAHQRAQRRESAASKAGMR